MRVRGATQGQRRSTSADRRGNSAIEPAAREPAKRRAQEAERRAELARKLAEQAWARAQKAELQAQAQRQRAASASKKDAPWQQRKAQKLDSNAKDLFSRALVAEKQANEAARSQGKSGPYTANSVKDTFDAAQVVGAGTPGRVIRSNAKVIHGTPGDDIIYGGSAHQRIIGGGGNDIIIGRGGGDRILGGSGNDRIYGGEGGDTLRGGTGKDLIAGGRANDRLNGDGGRDRLAGELGDDHVFGGRGNDRATGGMGIDNLKGGRGNDVQRGDAGPDFVDGGRGNDTVSYETQAGPGYSPENPNSGVLVMGNTPSTWKRRHEDVFYPGSSYGGSRAAGGSGVDGLKSNENVLGSAKDDLIVGKFKRVEGGPGRDTTEGNIGKKLSTNGEPDKVVSTPGAVVEVSRSQLTGGTTINVTGGKHGDDITVRKSGDWVTVTDTAGVAVRGRGRVQGNTVRFHVSGRLDAVQIDGGDGNDQIKVLGTPTKVPVTISGGEGNDRLIGGRGNDVLNDGPGNDVLKGGGGSDGLTNSQGRDRLHGGKGADLLVSSSIDRGDLLDGGRGEDNVSFAQIGHEFGVRAHIGGKARRIGPNGKPQGPAARITKSGNDLEGTERADILIGDHKTNHILGRGGADTLIGRGGDDLLEARDGEADRKLDGRRGHDKVTLDSRDRRVVSNVEYK